ncbi:MAG TPA: cation:proton antiporter [Aggregatilineales bacterium]|nr:cation:proton antiporter [Aggregatilineales bacterium]HPV07830.1 cation:proton antiporter [Aggregatilineales bacterium]HQA68211.1 cation:proton antiporter [Aggregatilineales bacterium]HQE17562.1 cation:proton antiporter [Aggregatilineales bacterium]
MEFDILNLFLVVLLAWLAANLAQRLKYPAVLGELAVGIVLGPPLLGLLHGGEALDVLGELGILLMMLYVGMEINPRDLGKASWPGLLAAIGGFIVPFVLGYFAVIWLGGTPMGALFVAIAVGVTSLATKSRILADLKLLNTRVAHVLMAGALVSDSLALIVFAAVISLAEVGTIEFGQVLLVGGRSILFFAVTTFIGLKVFPLIWPSLDRWGFRGRTFSATLVLLIALAFAGLAELAGLHAILGAFIAGLFLREGVLDRTLSHQITDVVHDVSIGFLAPIFFVMAGFEVSFGVFQTDLVLLLTVLVVATVGKIFGTALFYLPSGHGWREGITVGAGMNGRGAVEVIIAGIALQMGIISQEIFSILVFMAIFTTATVPFFLKWGVEWLRSRGELVSAEDDRKVTIIVGAGPFARKTAKILQAAGPVWLIDKNRNDYELAVQDGLNAIHGDALDENVMADAGGNEAHTLIALTTNSEVNILAAQLARRVFDIPRLYVLLTQADNGSLRNLADLSGAEKLQMELADLEQWDHWITHGEVAEYEVVIEEPMSPQEAFEKFQAEQPSVPVLLQHNGRVSMFRNVEELNVGDRVTLLRRTA